MWLRILIPFLQTSSLRVKKIYCTFLKTMKQWSKCSLKDGAVQWDMFPGLTELLFDRINLDSKIDNKNIDTQNQLADIETKAKRTREEWNHLLCLFIISHSSSTVCSVQWRNDLNKIQKTNVSQQNRDLWWIWPRGCLRSCLLQLHQTRGWPRMDIKILENLLQVTIEWGNLTDSHQQDTQNRIMIVLGLLKSGKVRLRHTIDQENLRKLLWIYCKKLTLIVKNLFSAEMRIPQGTESLFTIERGNLCWRIFQEQAYFENFVMGSDATEFVNQVRNQVRIRQKRMSSIAENCTEHSIIWWMFKATTLNAATYMGKNYSTMQNVVKNPRENQHLSWIMYTWDAFKDNVKQAKILWTITEPCSNREFQRRE